jgi:hypothetical protein
MLTWPRRRTRESPGAARVRYKGATDRPRYDRSRTAHELLKYPIPSSRSGVTRPENCSKGVGSDRPTARTCRTAPSAIIAIACCCGFRTKPDGLHVNATNRRSKFGPNFFCAQTRFRHQNNVRGANKVVYLLLVLHLDYSPFPTEQRLFKTNANCHRKTEAAFFIPPRPERRRHARRRCRAR